jgi:hypothetical protein
MRFAWRMHAHLSGRNGHDVATRADGPMAGLHDEQFPLRKVGVEWADGRAGRNAPDLQIERMPAAPWACISDTSQREG